jgi:hypothetical protein
MAHPQFRVLCPNKKLGIGPHKANLPLKDARFLADMSGSKLIHFAQAHEKNVETVVVDRLLLDIQYLRSLYL